MHPLTSSTGVKTNTPTIRRVSGQRYRRSGGNAIIEGVFTLLPTLALIFFMTDIGLMTFRWSTLQNAVREGARFAVTFDTDIEGVSSNSSQDAAIKAVVQKYAMRLVTTTDSPQHIFVDYYPPDGTTTTAISATNIGACGAASPRGNCPGNVVEVSVKNVSLTWLAPLSGSFGAGIPLYRNSTPITLAVYSSDILGGYPLGVTSVAR